MSAPSLILDRRRINILIALVDSALECDSSLSPEARSLLIEILFDLVSLLERFP